MKYTPRDMQGVNPNVPTEHPLKEFTWLIVCSVVLVLALYFALGWGAERLAMKLPLEWEQQIAAIETFFDADPELAAVDGYLAEIVSKLAAQNPSQDYNFKVLTHCTEIPNAFALPGGIIVVTSGLFDQVASENGLAFVLGHEIAHITHRDHLRGLGRALVVLTIGTLLLGGESDLMARWAGNLMGLSELKFSREQEESADALGVQLLKGAYGHAGGAEEFFTNLKAHDTISERIPEFFSTHPKHDRRLTRLRAMTNGEVGPLTPLRESAAACRAKTLTN